MKKICGAVVLCLVLLAPALASAWEGDVVRVSDGDTVVVERVDENGVKERVSVRLYGIDAPERQGSDWDAQPYCNTSRRFVAELLVSGRVSVMDLGRDKYGRTIGGVISLPDGKVLQEELLKAGLAWVYTAYCRDCRQWKELEKKARAEASGLWKDADPVPPWEWRKAGKARSKKVVGADRRPRKKTQSDMFSKK